MTNSENPEKKQVEKPPDISVVIRAHENLPKKTDSENTEEASDNTLVSDEKQENGDVVEKQIEEDTLENPNTEIDSSVLTEDAKKILENVDNGGVPSFISNNFKRILLENGLSSEEIRAMAPADAVGWLRKKSEQTKTEKVFQVFPLSENPNTEDNKPEDEDNVSERNEKQNIENQNPNEQISLKKIIKEVDEEGGEKETVLSLTKEFLEDVDYRQTLGEDPSDDISEHGKEVLTKNGFSKEEIEKMTKQEAIGLLREKIKELEIQSALEQGKNDIEQEAEEAGLSDRIRKIGESYNKVPLKYKFLIGAGLGIGSVALSGTAAAGCTLCLFSQRILGGAGTFVMIEGLLQRAAEKGGRERGKWEKRRHSVEAAILGAAVGSRGVSFLNDHFSSLDPSVVPLENAATEIGAEVGQDIPTTPPDTPPSFTETPFDGQTPETPGGLDTPTPDEGDSLSEIFNGPNEAAASGVIETPAAEVELSFTVGGEETGTLWGGIEKTLQDQGYFNGLDEGRQTFLTDSIKDKFATMSPEELREIGISSGDISLVHPGETIDLSSVLEDTTSVNKLTEQARELPDSVSNRIVENNEIIARWAHEHPHEALTDNNIGEIIQDAPEQVANSVSQESADKMTNSVPDTQTAVSETGATDSIPVGIEDQNTSVETNLPGTENTSNVPTPESQPYVIQAMSEDLNKLYGNLETNPNIPIEGSAHWIGENGLGEQTVEKVMTTDTNFLSSEGVGIESSDAVSATQEHIKHLVKESHLHVQQDETVGEFFKRAHDEIYYHKIMS